jgi:hypothetical protein
MRFATTTGDAAPKATKCNLSKVQWPTTGSLHRETTIWNIQKKRVLAVEQNGTTWNVLPTHQSTQPLTSPMETFRNDVERFCCLQAAVGEGGLLGGTKWNQAERFRSCPRHGPLTNDHRPMTTDE